MPPSAARAILFFDEADALFGKRSAVKDSQDRYTNIEINYLLQRMEDHRGLAIVATNMESALDAAFFCDGCHSLIHLVMRYCANLSWMGRLLDSAHEQHC
jgi:ATP-dependent 26S proteasome regulatory subunit